MLAQSIAAAFLGAAAYYDLRWMRIPNRLQLTAIPLIWLVVIVFEAGEWKMRLLITLFLTFLLLAGQLLKWNGGGDWKMMLWFGAGFGLDALAILPLTLAAMGVFAVGCLLMRRTPDWLPLAPFLLFSCLFWEMIFF